jgi:hypothetical protein
LRNCHRAIATQLRKYLPKRCSYISTYMHRTIKAIATQRTLGVDVMITILCDFRKFSAKNVRFSRKLMYTM